MFTHIVQFRNLLLAVCCVCHFLFSSPCRDLLTTLRLFNLTVVPFKNFPVIEIKVSAFVLKSYVYFYDDYVDFPSIDVCVVCSEYFCVFVSLLHPGVHQSLLYKR